MCDDRIVNKPNTKDTNMKISYYLYVHYDVTSMDTFRADDAKVEKLMKDRGESCGGGAGDGVRSNEFIVNAPWSEDQCQELLAEMNAVGLFGAVHCDGWDDSDMDADEAVYDVCVENSKV